MSGWCHGHFWPTLEVSVQAKAKHWGGIDLGKPFIIAVNNCHCEFHWDSDDASIKCALMGDPDAADHAIFQPALHRISGVIVVGKAYMGAERGAPDQTIQKREQRDT